MFHLSIYLYILEIEKNMNELHYLCARNYWALLWWLATNLSMLVWIISLRRKLKSSDRVSFFLGFYKDSKIEPAPRTPLSVVEVEKTVPDLKNIENKHADSTKPVISSKNNIEHSSTKTNNMKFNIVPTIKNYTLLPTPFQNNLNYRSSFIQIKGTFPDDSRLSEHNETVSVKNSIEDSSSSTPSTKDNIEKKTISESTTISKSQQNQVYLFSSLIGWVFGIFLGFGPSYYLMFTNGRKIWDIFEHRPHDGADNILLVHVGFSLLWAIAIISQFITGQKLSDSIYKRIHRSVGNFALFCGTFGVAFLAGIVWVLKYDFKFDLIPIFAAVFSDLESFLGNSQNILIGGRLETAANALKRANFVFAGPGIYTFVLAGGILWNAYYCWKTARAKNFADHKDYAFFLLFWSLDPAFNRAFHWVQEVVCPDCWTARIVPSGISLTSYGKAVANYGLILYAISTSSYLQRWNRIWIWNLFFEFLLLVGNQTFLIYAYQGRSTACFCIFVSLCFGINLLILTLKSVSN